MMLNTLPPTSTVCSAATGLQDPQNSRFLNTWADDLSCALFGMANSVTAMFYLIDATTGKDALVEGGEIDRPPWLGFSVHVFNTIVAWADICCAHPRSFSKRSGRLSVGIIAFYTVWILICSHFNGAFPYPILNQLPWPAVSPCKSLFALLSCCTWQSFLTRPEYAFGQSAYLSFRFHCYVCVSKRSFVHAVKVYQQKCVLQGFIGMASTSITLFYLMFLAGRQFCGRLLRKRSKIE